VLGGDTLLGIDLYSRYYSVWNWDAVTVLEMTKSQNQVDD